MKSMTVDSPSTFVGRRARVLDAIDSDAIGLVRGAPAPRASRRFRQTNDFYYLTGLEVPHAYLLLEGATGRSTIYVPPRDERRAENEGREVGAEDDDAIRELAGVDQVASLGQLATDLASLLSRTALSRAFVPLSPAEGERANRDTLFDGTARRAQDPWSSSETEEAAFARLLRSRFPRLTVEDLSPTLDALRLIKDEDELELMRRAGSLCGEAVLEAMRSTEPGIFEFELEAVAEFVFRRAGARGGAYQAIVAGGRNAWYGHYCGNDSRLEEGDLVLMDYAPDLDYYTSDIGRMWPVSGTFTPEQRELYGFIVRYRRALLARIRGGVEIPDILDGAAKDMEAVVDDTAWSKQEYEAAARNALSFRGHLSHPVGMAVHDVGDPRGVLRAGYVFSVDPMLWVPEEHLYVRVEDTVVVTQDGLENLTGLVPVEPEAVEAAMRQPGLLQWKEAP
jgi:Xaa-Pro aminopeptidase